MYKKKVVKHWPKGEKEMTVSICSRTAGMGATGQPFSVCLEKTERTWYHLTWLVPLPSEHICANKLRNKEIPVESLSWSQPGSQHVLRTHLDFGCEKQHLSGWCSFSWIFLLTQNVVPVSFSCFKRPLCVMLWSKSKVSGRLMFSVPGCRTGAVWGNSETFWKKSRAERWVSKEKPLTVAVLATLCCLAWHYAPWQAPAAMSEAVLWHA